MQKFALFAAVLNFHTILHDLFHQSRVILGEQLPMDAFHKEGADVVLVLLYDQ